MENNAEMVKEHTRNLSNIFGRLSKTENEMAEVLAWKERVDMDLYNHGKDGMKTQLTKFISDHEAREDEREKERAKRDRRMNLMLGVMGVIIALLTLVIGWKTYIDTMHHVKDGDLKIPSISHANPPDPVLSFEHPQDAAIPMHP